MINKLFVYACKNGDTELVKLLLLANTCQIDPGTDNNCAIRCASEMGHTEIVKLLLNDPRVDPSADDNYAIQWASLKGYTEVVRLLLNDPRVNPNDNNKNAMRWASLKGYTEIVKLLLRAVDPGDNNRAIRLACNNSHTEIVKLLLNDPRVDPSSYDNNAVKYTRSMVIMDILLEKVHLPTGVDITNYKKFLIRKKYMLKLLSTKVYDYSKLF